MLTQHFFPSFTAVLFYLLAALCIFRDLKSGAASNAPAPMASIFWILALILHALAATRFATPGGFDFALFNAVSIVGLLLAMTLLFGCFYRPLASLGVVVLPLAAASVALGALGALGGRPHIIPDTAALGLRVHILSAFVAYGVLNLAGVQALALVAQQRRLRQHRPSPLLDALPPLDAMERFLVLLLSVGVAFLSLGLVSGLLTYDDILAQHLAHKTFFSAASWAVFTALLGGYFMGKLHGGKVVTLTLWGIVLLLTAYFGSKFVLEFLLQR